MLKNQLPEPQYLPRMQVLEQLLNTEQGDYVGFNLLREMELVEDDEVVSDDEAEELRMHAMEVLRKLRMSLPLDEEKEVKESRTQIIPVDEMDEGNDTPYMDSSEEYSYDEDEHGNSVRMKSRFPRFDSKAAIPIFSLGMTFRGRRQFKRALGKYGLAMKRHICFVKDEAGRIRAKCSWPKCPWLIYGAKRSSNDWFQVITLVDNHICPQRRDNRLVTAPRIADKYERIMKANPGWKVKSI